MFDVSLCGHLQPLYHPVLLMQCTWVLHWLNADMYSTNHKKLNVLQEYLFSENMHGMGTGVPVLLFTLYSNQQLKELFNTKLYFWS